MDNYFQLDTNKRLQDINKTLQEVVAAINNLTNKLGDK